MIAFAVLLNGIAKGLASKGVLQFGGGDGEAVETEQNVDALLVLEAEMDLAGDGEAVGLIECRRFGIEAAGGGEVGEEERLSEEIDAVAEHFECAARIEREGEFGEEGFGCVGTVIGGDDLLWFGLGGLDEFEHEVRMEGAGTVVEGGIAFLVSTGSRERIFDGGFESDFPVIDHYQSLRGLVAVLVRRGSGLRDTVRRQRNQRQAEFLLALLDIVEDRIQVVVEPRGVLIAEFPDFFDYGIIQHEFSVPLIVRACIRMGSEKPAFPAIFTRRFMISALTMCRQFQVAR